MEKNMENEMETGNIYIYIWDYSVRDHVSLSKNRFWSRGVGAGLRNWPLVVVV